MQVVDMFSYSQNRKTVRQQLQVPQQAMSIVTGDARLLQLTPAHVLTCSSIQPFLC